MNDMNEKISDENKGEGNRQPKPRRAFILTENTLVYEVETQENPQECQPTRIEIQSHIPIEVRRDRVSVFFAFLAAVISAVTLIIVAKYTYFAGGQWQEMVRSATAAKQAAEAATEANKVSRDALNSVQRAFIIMSEFNGHKANVLYPIGENIWQFNPIWENAGNTPASPSIHDSFIKLMDKPPDEGEFIGKETEYPAAQIGPHARVWGVVKNISEAELLEARVGAPNKKKFFAWGWTAYRDVLPGTETHVTEFCLELKQISYFAGQPGTAPSLTWSGCREHNCVDEQCKDYDKLAALLHN